MRVDEEGHIVSFAKVVDEDNQGKPGSNDAEEAADADAEELVADLDSLDDGQTIEVAEDQED